MIKTAQDIKSYKKQLKEALQDQFLRQALGNFNKTYRENRDSVYAETDFDAIKHEIAADKDAALPRLQTLMQEFRRHAVDAGMQVHVATDAAEANQIISRIAQDNDVKQIIKSKSMTAEEETAGSLARQNYKAFENAPGDIILTLCASCAYHLKHYYPKIARQAGIPEKNMAAFVDKVMDFSSFMANVLDVSPDAFQRSAKKVAYHSPCHLCRGMGVTAEPRQLIETAGLNYVPCDDEDVCCGFGGSYSVDFPEISAEILKQKLAGVSASGADVLVSDCPGCVLQLRGGMDKQGHHIAVKHISELVADQLKVIGS